jgi:hypothetical protein
MPEILIKFRRCPECRRTETVETGEVIAAGNQRHNVAASGLKTGSTSKRRPIGVPFSKVLA